jgi:hypothetical protein
MELINYNAQLYLHTTAFYQPCALVSVYYNIARFGTRTFLPFWTCFNLLR